MKPELLNVGSNAVRVGVRAIWGVLLPGLLAVHDFGTYTLILGGAQILSTLALLGSPNAALSGVVGLRVLLVHTVVLGAVLAGAVVLLAPTSGAQLYLIVGVQVMSLHVLLSGWARGRGRFSELLVSYVVGYLLFAVAAAATLYSVRAFGAMLPLWLELIGPAVSLALLVWLVARRPGGPDDGNEGAASAVPVTRSLKQALRPVYAIGGLVVVDVIIWRRIEIFFLQGSPSGSTGVAVFGLAIQLAMTALLLPAAVIEAWYPQLARDWLTAGSEFGARVRQRMRSYRVMYLAVALVSMAAFAVAIPLVYPEYRPWLGLVLTLIAMRLAAGYFGFHSTVLYATGREMALYAPVIAGAVVALVAHGLLTLRYGLPVLPVAYALTHGVTAVGTWWVYRRREQDVPPVPSTTSDPLPAPLPAVDT